MQPQISAKPILGCESATAIPMEALIPMLSSTVKTLDLEADYTSAFDDAIRSNSYVLTQLLLQLNDHFGQVNYFRRILI